MKKENSFRWRAEQEYAAPQIELIEVENSHNILGGSSELLPGMPGEDWFAL